MTSKPFVYASVSMNDFDELVQIRIAAMCESLERLGRFDPTRARERLANEFQPDSTKAIEIDSARIGFVVAISTKKSITLAHLYLLPASQGLGFGSLVLADILARADAKGLPVNVTALKKSEANRFYQHHGFESVGEDEFDTHYRRDPQDSRPDS